MIYFFYIIKNIWEGRFDSGVIIKGIMKIIMWNIIFFFNFVFKIDKYYYKFVNVCSVVFLMWYVVVLVFVVINVFWGGSMFNKCFSRYDFLVFVLLVKKMFFFVFIVFSIVICLIVRFVWKEFKLLRCFCVGLFLL